MQATTELVRADEVIELGSLHFRYGLKPDQAGVCQRRPLYPYKLTTTEARIDVGLVPGADSSPQLSALLFGGFGYP